jgi:hypothetical protein
MTRREEVARLVRDLRLAVQVKLMLREALTATAVVENRIPVVAPAFRSATARVALPGRARLRSAFLLGYVAGRRRAH